MTSKHRSANILSLLILLLSSASSQAGDQTAKRPINDGTDKPPAKLHVPFTISKETTFIVEPLDKAGYPDYVAALNQRFGNGVTPENNAVVRTWRAFGPQKIAKEQRLEFFKLLGIEPLPEKGDYFIELKDYPSALDDASSIEHTATYSSHYPLDDLLKAACTRPWSKREFPNLSAWLDLNEKPLVAIVAASKRPRYFDPLVRDKPETVLMMVPSDTARCIMAAAQALCARAMRFAGQNQWDRARDDVLACHRLARLVAVGPSTFDCLRGFWIEIAACYADEGLLRVPRITKAQCTKLQSELVQLQPLTHYVDKLDAFERFAYLDAALSVARKYQGKTEALAYLRKLNIPSESEGAVRLMIGDNGSPFDWDEILRFGNVWSDRLAIAGRETPRSKLRMAVGQVCIDYDKENERGKNDLVKKFLGDPRKNVTESMRRSLSQAFAPSSGGFIAEDRAATHLSLARIAVALAAYNADHGTFPTALTKLSPKYLATIPKDLFNDKHLHYVQKDKGYLLYSVGMNGEDDGGRGLDDHYEDSEKVGDDIAVHMSERK